MDEFLKSNLICFSETDVSGPSIPSVMNIGSNQHDQDNSKDSAPDDPSDDPEDPSFSSQHSIGPSLPTIGPAIPSNIRYILFFSYIFYLIYISISKKQIFFYFSCFILWKS